MSSMFRTSCVFMLFVGWTAVTAPAAWIRGRTGERHDVNSKVANPFLQSVVAAGARDKHRAISLLTAALQANPDSAAAATIYDIRGCFYVDIEDFPRALEDANESLRLNPRLPGGYQTRGRVYRRQGKGDDAIREYNQALELKPDFTQIFINRGVAYMVAGDNDRAMQDFDEAIRRDPKLVEAYVSRGILYYDLGQYEKSLADYNKAIRLYPAMPDVYYNRSLAFAKTGQTERAMRDANEAIRRDPTNADRYLWRGKRYAVQGTYQKALADWRKARDLQPADNRILNSIAWFRATCPDEAHRDGKEAVELALQVCQRSDWCDSVFLDTLAAAYAEEGDFDKAAEYENQALELREKRDHLEEMQSRLRLYQERKPFREPVPAGRQSHK